MSVVGAGWSVKQFRMKNFEFRVMYSGDLDKVIKAYEIT